MNERLDVLKTYKLFIGGAFPRSESGRTMIVRGPEGELVAHACKASRKDLRDAVSAARNAFEGAGGWARRTAYNRGQILYRLAEMLEGRAAEFAGAIDAAGPAAGASSKGKRSGRAATSGKAPRRTSHDEVRAAVDRLVAYAGWCDKFAQVLGCQNPVAGPYYTFTVPEPTGVVAVVSPDEAPLLGLVSLIAPPLCAGNTVVALASETNPLPACVLAEVCATSDVPGGVVNILTGERAELVPQIAGHREIDAVHACEASPTIARALLEGSAENVKRVTVRGATGGRPDWFDHEACASPWWIERFVEMKTIWHPSGA